MPTHEFRCACGLQFDAYVKLGDHTKPRVCPACGEQAAPLVPSQVQGHFNKTVSGPVPQNTGIHDLDTHIDRVIGQSAKQGWDVAEARVRDKHGVLADNPGATGHDLSRNPDGTYRVLSAEERAAHERSQKIHGTAMTLASQHWKTTRGARRSR